MSLDLSVTKEYAISLGPNFMMQYHSSVLVTIFVSRPVYPLTTIIANDHAFSLIIIKIPDEFAGNCRHIVRIT